MHFEAFETEDLEHIEALQPPNWGPLRPRFETFIHSPKAEPIKLIYQHRMIGVGVTLFHEDSIWLACIIVHPDFRNQGLGTKITQELLNRWDRSRYSTCSLDATDLGFPVYQKLGFQLEKKYAHFKRPDEAPKNRVFDKTSEKLIPFKEVFWEQILELDFKASKEKRFALLEKHKQSMKLVVGEKLEGFYIPELNDGLIIAENPLAGLELMKLRILDFNYAVVPVENQIATDFLRAQHFQELRQSRRMCLGLARDWIPSYLYNRISGQFG